MKHLVLLVTLALLMSWNTAAQYQFEPSKEFPFGRANPNSPEQVKDWEELIGLCECSSMARKADGSWNEPEQILWTWEYIMNGTAVQDKTLKPDGSHSGSIRQFIADSARWYVHYYSNKTPTPVLGAWEGNRSQDSIILYRDQKAPNGMDGKYKIVFSNISPDGYEWEGAWVSTDESFVYPTWKISCKKKK